MLRKIGAFGAAALVGSGLAAGQAFAEVAAPQEEESPQGLTAEAISGAAAQTMRMSFDEVVGAFSFSQDVLSTHEEMARAVEGSKYLCASEYAPAGEDGEVDPMQWEISIGGEVQHSFDATMEELSKTSAATLTMGCVCYGNGAGGISVLNAMVKGIEIEAIAEAAGVSESANTIVIGCNDGYEVALPLDYVQRRYSMIVYEANGSALASSIGGTNQLWLGSTAGNYFARDVVSITYETRQTPPPYPYTDEGDDYYGNFPGIGITAVQ